MKKIILFFDKLEDKIRISLSRSPNIYAFVSGVGIVLFFRGVWMITDNSKYFYGYPLDGWLTLAVSLAILLLTGTLVSHHLTNDVLISGKRGEKKLAEMKIEDIKKQEKIESQEINDIKRDISEIKNLLQKLTDKS
jgi:hypothetical protein